MFIHIYTYILCVAKALFAGQGIDGKSGTDRRKKWYRFAIIDGKSGTDRRKKWYRCTLKKCHLAQYLQGFADLSTKGHI